MGPVVRRVIVSSRWFTRGILSEVLGPLPGAVLHWGAADDCAGDIAGCVNEVFDYGVEPDVGEERAHAGLVFGRHVCRQIGEAELWVVSEGVKWRRCASVRWYLCATRWSMRFDWYEKLR